MKYPGKTTCDPAFIARFFEARDQANKTGKPVPIPGYSGYRVHPQKDLGTDDSPAEDR